MVKEIKENKYLTEMAMERGDAILACISRGKKFIMHFHKIYNNPNDDSVNHWITEMNAFYGDIKEIRLKPKSKHLLNVQLSDWFFTAGADPKDYMDKENTSDEELEAYDKFCTLLMTGKSIRDALKELNIII